MTLVIWDEKEKSETQLQYATLSAKCWAVGEEKKNRIFLWVIKQLRAKCRMQNTDLIRKI